MRLESRHLKPLMVFNEVSDFACSSDFVIDEVGRDTVMGRLVHHGGDTTMMLSIEKLLDPALWTFNGVVTAGVLDAKIRHMEEQLKIARPSSVASGNPKNHEAHLFEHRQASDPIKGCARCNLPYHEGAHRSPEGVMRELESLKNEVASKYLLRATVEDAEVGRAVKALEAERDAALKEVHDLRLQNWKLTDAAKAVP